MNIVILGKGAMAGLFAALLTEDKPNWHISVKGRTFSCDHWQYTFSPLDGDTMTLGIPYAQKDDLKEADIILCCVKSYDVESAIKSIASFITPKASIILCHNGLGTLEQVQALLTEQHPIYAMITTMAAKRITAEHIVHTGRGDNYLGLCSGTQEQQQVNSLAQQITYLTLCEDISSRQWQKLAINCAINPLTAIYDVTNGELANECFRHTIITTLKEVVDVAATEGIHLAYQPTLDSIYRVIELTAQNSSSMREDVRYKRPTEIDFINGYIVNKAKQHQLEAPVNMSLWQQIADLDNY